MKTELTAKQEAFCREYLKDFCGAAAAERAGYSPRHSEKQAWNLLRDPRIAGRIQAFRDASNDETVMSLAEAKRTLSKMARGSVQQFLDPFGRIDPVRVREGGAELVEYSENETETATNRKIKIAPLAAIQELARIEGWHIKKIEHSGAIEERCLIVPLDDLRQFSPEEVEENQDAPQKD